MHDRRQRLLYPVWFLLFSGVLVAVLFFAMFFAVLWCIGPQTKAYAASLATQHIGVPADLSLWLYRVTSPTRQRPAKASVERQYQPVPVKPFPSDWYIWPESTETPPSRKEHGLHPESLSALRSILQLTSRTAKLIPRQNRAKTTKRMRSTQEKRQINYDRALAVQEKRELELAKSHEKWQLSADRLADQSPAAASSRRMTSSQVTAWRNLQEIVARFNRGDDAGEAILPHPAQRKTRSRSNVIDELISAHQRAGADLLRAKKRLAQAESKVTSAYRALRTIEQKISDAIHQRSEDQTKAAHALDRLAEATERFGATIRGRARLGDHNAISVAMVFRLGADALRQTIPVPKSSLRPNP